MDNIVIKRLTPDDVHKLQAISRQTFIETFSTANTAENMRKYLEEEYSVEKLTTELTDPNVEFYFTLLDNNVIGYLKLNSGDAQKELKDDNALEIERIYVLNAYHGKKVGQFLYEKAIQVARQQNADYLWLGVWEENQRALRFYQKNGFVPFDRHVFQLGDDAQTDIMMRLRLAGE